MLRGDELPVTKTNNMTFKKHFGLFITTLLSICSFGTWSIIIIDPVTRQIGIAAASCSYSVYGIGGIVPGKGAIVAQAMSNMKAKRKGMEMLASGISPEKILMVIIDPGFDRVADLQQYGIISVDYLDKPVTFTGGGTPPSGGSLKGYGFSVQGNTLTDSTVIKGVYDAITNAKKRNLSLHETLMIALEAGSKAGGDNRCGSQRATSAFLTIMNPNDKQDKPYLNLIVSGISEGGPNAVGLLREKYLQWKKK
jgi:uncharacterized Ntn-hydrolase superfamily protein